MATLGGDVLALNRLDTTMHAVGASVVVRLNGTTIGTGVVSDDDTFSIEIPHGIVGDVEVHLGVLNAAPTIASLDGSDTHITLLYSNVNYFLA